MSAGGVTPISPTVRSAVGDKRWPRSGCSALVTGPRGRTTKDRMEKPRSLKSRCKIRRHRVLPYGGGMKVWMVLALLAMGLGCSEEPPEQWSHPVRQVIVDACLEEGELALASNPAFRDKMAEEGVTPRDVCRCSLYEMERQHTESDFLLLSTAEATDVGERAGFICRDKLLGD